MDRKKTIILIVIVGLVVFGLWKNYSDSDKLNQNGLYTTGVITKLKFVRQSKYKLEYTFEVNGIEYEGSCSTSYFKCEDGTEGCQGKKFKVIYSELDPEVNSIDLGKYNKHKRTRPLFGF